MTELRELLAVYRNLWVRPDSPWFAHETETLSRMEQFLDSSPDVFRREHRVGHFTGSALVCTRSLTRVALMHHRKLEKWLQFGGHADGDSNLARVALREAEEESGLKRLCYLDFEEVFGCPYHPVPFDLDIHAIPARGEVDSHLHYDVRFLLWSEEEPLYSGHEAVELGWFNMAGARQRTQEESMLRQFSKLEMLARQLSAVGSARN